MNDTTDETAPVTGPGTPAAGHEGESPAGNPSGNQAGPRTGHPSGHPSGHQPPPYRRRVDELDQLRRSGTDRKIAGVAGGLARHFDIDPTVLRVLFVVLTFFGGAGLLVYGAIWLLVPEDGRAEAPVHANSETRKVLLVGTAILAALLAIGDSLGGFGLGWPLAVIAVFVAAYLLVTDRRRGGPGPRHDGSVPPPGTPQEGSAMSTTYDPARPAGAPGAVPDTADPATGSYPTDTSAGGPPHWQPPTGEPPYQPRRPRRVGTVWFWPTLALLAIGLGILGLYDAENPVADGAYPALALTIIGVMLVVGAVRGRPGGLILLGGLATVALAGNVAVGGEFGSDARQIHDTPTTAAAVEPEYRANVGEIRLDLTDVRNPAELAGRTIDLRLRTGHIHVIVPESINVQVDAEMEYAGGISVPGDEGGGLRPSVDRYLAGSPATNAEPLELDIESKFGQITVEQR